MKLVKHSALLLALSCFASVTWAQTIPNPSFEADHYFSGVGYASQNGGVITGWTISDPTHIGLNLGGTNNPGLLVDNGAIPNGTNVAFIQSNGTTNSLSTTITGLTPGTTYRVSFRANCRDSGYTFPNATWSLNGDVFVPFTCSPPVLGGNPYYTNTATFTATSATAALVLRNGIASGDGAVLLDNFTIATVVLAPSAFGAGLNFDGSSTYVSVTNFGSILPTNEITIEFWANATTANEQLAFTLRPDNLTNRLNAYVPFLDSKIYWDFGNSSSTGRVSVAFPTNSLKNWIHYAFLASKSGNFMKIYTNGNLLVSANYMTPVVQSIYELRIGGSPGAGNWNGTLDDFRVWNSARSQGQIQANLSTRLAGNESNLVAYYRFDQRDGSIATNYATATGAPYDGVLVNGPLWALGNTALAATGITTNSAILNGLVHPGTLGTSYYFQYGVTTNYGSTTPTNNLAPVASATNAVTVSNSIGGLVANTIYHFRVVTTDSGGVVAGNDMAFVTAGGNWTPLANTAPGPIGVMLLLSDGTIMAKEDDRIGNFTNWWHLTPDTNGHYANGTWSTNIAAMRDSRLFFASEVLKDGRVFVAGGEYGTGKATSEVYNPVSNVWTVINVPTNLLDPTQASAGRFVGNQAFLDSNAKILPNGKVLVTPVLVNAPGQSMIFDPDTSSWAAGPNLVNLLDQDESSWVKLPDDSILTIDPFGTNTERYLPGSNTWIADASLPLPLYSPVGGELGPAFMLANGKAIFFGATTNTAIYTPSGSNAPGIWAVGPSFPSGQGMPDAPGAMMVNGKILVGVSPTPFTGNSAPTPASFYEFDYINNTFTRVNVPGGGLTRNDQSQQFNMLDLPDGTVLLSEYGTGLYVYQPVGLPLTAGKPNIRSIAFNSDGSLHLTGTLFNGISEGASFGDDVQMDSNYPLVRFTDSNGIVRYGRTYNWSSTSVQTGTNVVSTECTMPAGASLQDTIQVVANGITSDGVFYLALLATAVDATNLTWSSSGNLNWALETSVTHDGVDAAQSGPIANNQSSSLSTTVSGPGVLAFWWKVSSETNFDFLRFFVDGLQQPAAPEISGEVNWQQRLVSIPTGTHTLTWTYAKDASLSIGSDAGWLDQVVLTPSNVSTTNDSGPGSLRDIAANLPSGYTATFDSNLSGRTIALSNGHIIISNSITIDASSLAGGIKISGSNVSRVFLINPGVTNVLTGLTITAGIAVNGPLPVPTYGGGIFNQGNLTLSNCYVVANSGFAGGAIYTSSGGRLTLHACTLATNSASYGGAIQNEGLLQADNSTFTGNSASQQGGAISAPFSSPVALLQCTVSGNTGGDGGGLLGANIAIANTIVAGNTATVNPNLSGTFGTGGNNLTNGSPLLGALANYGGPTPTMRPLIGSPAIDAGTDSFVSGLAFDQRGRSRTSGSHVDIGAVEVTTNTIVTTTADSGAGSLRTVVANLEPGYTVTFANALAGQTIVLTSGQIVLDKNFTIDGSGNSIQISGNNATRIFFVNSGVNATLNGLTLMNGLASQGGAIQNLGSLTLNQCTLAGNRDNCGCGINGGAVLNRGTLTANNSTFSGNIASFGGAIFNDLSSTLFVNQSTFSGNVGTNGGGAIYNFQGTMTVNQSTIVGNQSPGGGSQGGGINNSGFGFFLTNSIVCANTASSSPNIAGVVTPFSSPNNLVDTNPLLSPLGNNGGPTQTMPPLAGSPALDAGNDAQAISFTTDQRGVGFPRVSGNHVDIGAVELQIITATNPPVLTGLTKLGDGTFKFSFTNLSGASFTVFASTNLALPINAWSNIGPAVETPAASGQFQFTDPQATNNSQRFYRVRSP